MKKCFLFICFLLSSLVQAQLPQKMSHRGTAYNGSGAVIINTQIGLRVSILNDSPTTGTAVYTEIHSAQTNISGQYSIEIGGGAAIPPNSSLSTIDWSLGPKYLKIEIDVDGNTNGINYTVSGSSQLMSVPYALYSNKTNNSIEVVNNIQELKNFSGFQDKKTVFVKGYYNEGDGGGGMFIYKINGTNSTAQSQVENPNDGTIFKSSVSSAPINGRWFRLYDGFINILFFGVVKDLFPNNLPQNFSNSDRIQAAIDYSSGNSNTIYNKNLIKTLFFPNGLYFIDKAIYLKDKLNILGGSGSLLQIADNFHDDYMFKLDSGTVTSLRLEGFIINLSDKVGVGGMHLKGIGNPTGGLWTSTIKNLDIINLKGNGIYLEGGDSANGSITDSDNNIPFQFNLFESINVTRKHPDYYALKLTGQNANYNFINCQFVTDPNAHIDGTCIYIASINSGTSYNKTGSEALSFINCGFGGVTRYGAMIKDSGNITFDTCFFEALDICFDISDSRQISISNCRFANAAGMGTRTESFTNNIGTCLHVLKSSVIVKNNYVAVTDTNSSLLNNQSFIISDNTNSTLTVSSNDFQSNKLSKTFGVMQTTSILNNGIDIYGKKLVFVTVPTGSIATNNKISRINSSVGAGETIFIRANQGPILFEAMDAQGILQKNIFLNGRSSLTIQNGQAVTFIKIDNIVGNENNTYQLVSISD